MFIDQVVEAGRQQILLVDAPIHHVKLFGLAFELFESVEIVGDVYDSVNNSKQNLDANLVQVYFVQIQYDCHKFLENIHIVDDNVLVVIVLEHDIPLVDIKFGKV